MILDQIVAVMMMILVLKTSKEHIKRCTAKGFKFAKINRSLEIYVDELRKEKDILKRAMINYEFLAVEKE